MAEQKELFDGFLRLRKCRKCQRKLHVDPNDNYKTRLAGLCYACVREFEKSPHWDVDKFIESEKQAVLEFYEAADSFGELFNDA